MNANATRAARGWQAINLHPDVDQLEPETTATDVIADILHAMTTGNAQDLLDRALRTYTGDAEDDHEHAPPFDPLDALSRARTALDDPAAVGLAVPGEAWFEAGSENIGYAVQQIDEVIGALRFEPANDYRGEARWVMKNLGRLLNAVAQELAEDGSNENVHASNDLSAACDLIDEAINRLTP